jgi:formate/nitrite transporter FocA (FNT family)
MLGIVAGGFIGLGALYYTVIISDTQLTFGLARLLGGIAFSLGLVLVWSPAPSCSRATTCS